MFALRIDLFSDVGRLMIRGENLKAVLNPTAKLYRVPILHIRHRLIDTFEPE